MLKTLEERGFKLFLFETDYSLLLIHQSWVINLHVPFLLKVAMQDVVSCWIISQFRSISWHILIISLVIVDRRLLKPTLSACHVEILENTHFLLFKT